MTVAIILFRIQQYWAGAINPIDAIERECSRVILRAAKAQDFSSLLPYAITAHKQSPLSSLPIDENKLRRVFITSIAFDDGYVKVIEKNGEVVGGLLGMVAENALGLRIAYDLFCYAECATHILIKDFMRWAKARHAHATQITDQSGSVRYQTLIKRLGLTPAGTNFIEVN